MTDEFTEFLLSSVVAESSAIKAVIHYYLLLEGSTEPFIASVTNYERADHFAIGDVVWAGFRGAAAVALRQK